MVDNYVVRNPVFDGTNYAFWNIKMKAYLNALSYDVWQSVVDGYTPPSTPPTDAVGKRKSENNAKVEHALLCSLADSEFTKVMHCKSAKEIWNKLKSIYEGDEKVREDKLQSLRMKFESLKMKEDEDIATYFLHVDEIVNAIIALGEEVEDTPLVRKLLRTLTMKFDPKISAIEEMKDLKTLTKDELFGILTAYEMRREDKPSQKEVSFKASKKGKNKNHTPKESTSSESDEVEAYFMRKFKKGKGKFPFKCFNCGKVGHYASKCPQNESDSSEEEKKSYSKKKGKKYFKKNYSKHKKSFYSKQSSSSLEETSEDMSSSDGEEILFMAMKVKDDEDEKEEGQEAICDEEDIDEGKQFEKAIEDHPKEQSDEEELKEESENEEQESFETPSKTPSETPLKTPSKTPSKFVQKNHPESLVIGELDINIQTRRRLATTIKHAHFCLLSKIEPRNFDEASEDKYWVNAMNEELDQIERNHTCELVPRPSNKNVIGTKWVFSQ
ncbi:uncharacterized protein LOC131876101 [Cryptomeria japonica]|uniref:uncharacterized protein LOC131876101 n=1 Tax=Cryptomeria japonica TaxID=3369 RepID=UPI0027DAB19B|nr:uncharacterized protein LOC131876101 [Cryptomeria japonica]